MSGCTDDGYDDVICARCDRAFFLRDGYEPTKYCDECAQELVEELEQQLAELQAVNLRLQRRVESLEVVAEQSPITDAIINKIKAAKGCMDE
jgi:PHP family Zn ribbon phosphoesterase